MELPGRPPAAVGAVAGDTDALSEFDAFAGEMAPTSDDGGLKVDAGALTGEGGAIAGELTPVADDSGAITGEMAPVAGGRDAITGEMTPISGDVALCSSDVPCASTSGAIAGELAPIAGELAPIADDWLGFPAEGNIVRTHCLCGLETARGCFRPGASCSGEATCSGERAC